MKPELIVMLTHHDRTVINAMDLFEECKRIPVNHWGFKDVGLPQDQMKALVQRMKAAGKTTCLEVVSLSEEKGLIGAELACEANFDILMGTIYAESINKCLQGTTVKYYPFLGRVYGHPNVLGGRIDEIVGQARCLEDRGVHGFDLLSYRYTGQPRELLKAVAPATRLPIVSAGSIASFERIAEVWDAKCWGFTIGSAFFDCKFEANGTFKTNLSAVVNWLEKTTPDSMRNYLRDN